MVPGTVVRTKVGALTARAIERLPAGKKISDGAIEGGNGRLIVRAREAAGGVQRQFYFRWQDPDGSDRTLHLGDFPDLSLADARTHARELQRVRGDGGDPRLHVEKRQIERERTDREKREAGTFGDLLDAYVAWLRTEGKGSADDVERSLKRHVRKPFPHLVRRKAADISPQDVVDIIATMIRKGITRKANMVRSYLHAAFNRAVRSDLDPRRAAGHRSAFRITTNPARDVPRQGDFDRVGDRILTDPELKAYCLALAARGDPIAAALRISLFLGGQRLAQLLRVTWDDYDKAVGTLRIRDAKGRGGERDHVLPVSARVAALIPPKHPDGGEFIFTTGRKRAIHPSTLSDDVSTIAGGIVKRGPAFTARDLRRSVETRLAALGVSRDLRAQVLSHGLKRGVQEKHYDRHLYLQEKADVLALWEKHLDEVTKDKPPPVAKGRAKLRLVA